MNTDQSTKSKTRAQIEREKVLAVLDEADKDIPENPGQSGYTNGEGESFEKLFEASLADRDFKVGDVVKGKVVRVHDDYVLIDIN